MSLTKIEIVDAIEEHSLTIRRIPLSVCETNEMRHRREDDEIIKVAHTFGMPDFEKRKEYVKKIFSDQANIEIDEAEQKIYRIYCRRYRVPANAGCWMCKPWKDTCSRVVWDSREDNLAPTLGESISKFLESLNTKVKGAE